ncbi:hypothetical protein L1965_07385 [Paracoccus sp. EGI L200073]|nr:hypothetical protein [Paracoccus salsus]
MTGYGSPDKAGTYAAHGSPPGDEEAALTRTAPGRPAAPFEIPDDLAARWRRIGARGARSRAARHDRRAARSPETRNEVTRRRIGSPHRKGRLCDPAIRLRPQRDPGRDRDRGRAGHRGAGALHADGMNVAVVSIPTGRLFAAKPSECRSGTLASAPIERLSCPFGITSDTVITRASASCGRWPGRLARARERPSGSERAGLCPDRPLPERHRRPIPGRSGDRRQPHSTAFTRQGPWRSVRR